jgi:hypothetical protein
VELAIYLKIPTSLEGYFSTSTPMAPKQANSDLVGIQGWLKTWSVKCSPTGVNVDARLEKIPRRESAGT